MAVNYETINDIDGQVINFFKVCRDRPEELARLIEFTPFARGEYMAVQENHAGEEIQLADNPVENARRFAVRCSQGFGSKLADRCGWKNSKRSTGPINTRVWGKIPETIISVAERLKNAQIENADAIKLIRDYNAPDCLIYADPPYLGEVRNNKRIYRNEMMDAETHKRLLQALLEHRGMVILSGYDNDLYNSMLQGWDKRQKVGRANSAALRIETIWANFQLGLNCPGLEQTEL